MTLGMGRGMRRALFVGFFVLASSAAWSQSAPVSPETEYQKRIKVSEDIQPLGENPFGENVSLYNGALSFEETDVSAAGIGPLLQLSREFHVPDTSPVTVYHTFLNNAFVDWSLKVPRLKTLSAFLPIETGCQDQCARSYEDRDMQQITLDQ